MANVTQIDWKGSTPKSFLAALLLLELIVLTGAGIPACRRPSSDNNELAGDSPAGQTKGILHLDSFVVNLADPEENRFLRVGIDLGLGTPLPAKGSKGEEGEVPTGRIRDCVLAVVSTWRSDALLAPEGKQKLKDELRHALQDRVPELCVREVYFTDFLVQR